MYNERPRKCDLWDLSPDIFNHVVSIQTGFTMNQSYYCSHYITLTIECNQIPQYFHLVLFISLQFSLVLVNEIHSAF